MSIRRITYNSYTSSRSGCPEKWLATFSGVVHPAIGTCCAFGSFSRKFISGDLNNSIVLERINACSWQSDIDPPEVPVVHQYSGTICAGAGAPSASRSVHFKWDSSAEMWVISAHYNDIDFPQALFFRATSVDRYLRTFPNMYTSATAFCTLVPQPIVGTVPLFGRDGSVTLEPYC